MVLSSIEETVVTRLCDQARAAAGNDPNMGMLEKKLEQMAKPYLRVALERLVQERAGSVATRCPQCDTALQVESRLRRRTIHAKFGKISLARAYGYCETCHHWHYPADAALALQERAPASPCVQEICALTTLRDPAINVQEDTRRMTGVDMDPACIHREARRQGERARALRDADTALTGTPQGVAELAQRAVLPIAPFTLIIQMDAWNIRERNDWGQTEALRTAGQEPKRWHWVYTGTVFRLDQRATTASGRPVITERGYVATRLGLDAFREQLYAEALQRGLLQAELVLIIGDGAAWIWNLAKERFDGAQQRVDLFHVSQHLWAVAHDLHGQESPEAKAWVTPYLGWLKQRQDGALDVITSLEQIRDHMTALTSSQREALEREIGYFTEHRNRMDYKHGKALEQPVGSGAIESTCSQYQRRFKLRGQFWSLEGDEAFLALATLHFNGRWSSLFPHDDDQKPMA